MTYYEGDGVMEALGYPTGTTVSVMFETFEDGRADMVAVKLVMLETLEKDPVGPAV